MSGEEIEVECTPDGMTFNLKNFQGPTCSEQLDKILADLKAAGIESKVLEERKKAEYHVSRIKANQQRSRL